jgi:16S rRNA (uracil1498-N3)-methyltransferase
MDGESVIADILSVENAKGESPVAIHLFQAYPKSDKLEFIIQKSVELGVHTITPFESIKDTRHYCNKFLIF